MCCPRCRRLIEEDEFSKSVGAEQRNRKVKVEKFSKIVAVLLLVLPLAVAQEARPDEQTRVYQENGKWSRQITGSIGGGEEICE